MKNVVLSLVVALPAFVFGQGAFGEVIGTIVSAKDKSAVYGAVVKTEVNGSFFQARTDPDGRFRISAIPAGTYYFNIIHEGDTLKNVEARVPINGIYNMKTVEFRKTTTFDDVVITYDKDRLTLEYGVMSEIKMSAEDVAQSPARFDQKQLIANMSPEIKMSDDGQLMFRGARKGDMIYLMDGVKTTSITNVPSSSIGGMMVYTGGIPAKYGDTMGGVVVMETKSYFDLYNRWYGQQLRKGNF